MRNILRLTVSILFITISTLGQTTAPRELAQESEEKLLIKKGRELADQTSMKYLIQIDDSSHPDKVVFESAAPGKLLFMDERVKVEDNKSEYTTVVIIIGKEKETEKIQVRYHYQYTVSFEKRNSEWRQVSAMFTAAPKLI